MTEYIIAASISILYPAFFYKLSERVTGTNEISQQRSNCFDLQTKMNNNGGVAFVKTPEYDACWNKWDTEYGKADFKKYLMLLFAGMIGIIASGFIGRDSGWATKLGIAIGGLVTLLYAVTGWWNTYSENIKIALLGASLVILVLLSARLYKANSLVDVLTWDFN